MEELNDGFKYKGDGELLKDISSSEPLKMEPKIEEPTLPNSQQKIKLENYMAVT